MLIIAPPSGQISPNLVCPFGMGSVVMWPSLVMIRPTVAEIWAHFLFCGFAGEYETRDWPNAFETQMGGHGTSQSMIWLWNFFANPILSWAMRQNTFLLIIAPPSGQTAPNLFCLLGRVSVVCSPSLVKIRQTVAEIWAHFLFSSFAVKFDWLLRSNAYVSKRAFDNFDEAWSEDAMYQISAWLGKI